MILQIAIVGLLTACVGPDLAHPIRSSEAAVESVPQSSPELIRPTFAGSVPSALSLTYHNPDGNRYVEGKSALPEFESIDVQLSGQPAWLVAAPAVRGSLWVAVLEDGRVEAFHLRGRRLQAVEVSPATLTPGKPPALMAREGSIELIEIADAAASELTHAVPLESAPGSFAYLTQEGELAIWEGSVRNRLGVKALPDARLLMDEAGRLLLLSGATTEYGHGVLGDRIEASKITLIDTSPALSIAEEIVIPSPSVIEGTAPIWADLSGDGNREIIVTVSNADVGAQIVVYAETGELLAAGPAIGTGYRWRHHLAVAPFGPAGELELAVVRTPHIGGVVEYYRLVGDRLEIVARLAGYSSHSNGSRNLDWALAGDFDGDDVVELLLPDHTHQILAAIRRTSEGAMQVWSVPIGGRLTTNLAAVARAEGQLEVGVGHEGNTLRIWTP